MIDELTKEQVVDLLRGIDRTTGESVDGWWETSRGAAFGAEKLAAILAHDAALRASRDAERERAEKAERQLLEVAERNADLTAKLETMTIERNILYDTAVEDGLSAGTPTIDQAQELARMQGALAASEQRVKELEEFNRGNSTYPVKLQQLIENLKYDTPAPHPELYHHKIIVAFKQQLADAQATIARMESQLPEGMTHCTIVFKECANGHGWLTATNWVQHPCATCERDQLQATVAAPQGEIERLRGELAEILLDWDGPTRVGFTHGEYFATLFSERRDVIERLVSKGEKKGTL